jgi:thiol-disulfide isomerase/thioredoxin
VGTRLVFAGLLAACLTPVSRAQSLKVGDRAPNLQVMTWIKGQPITEFKKGRVYVVDFWATWCAPRRKSSPHLSEIARKYASDVTVIGVDARETEHADGKVQFVRDFVDAQRDAMDYNVAMDDPKDPRTFMSWVTASGLHLIPTCFIIDKQGRIAWVGHPTEGFTMFEQRVNETIAGTIDRAASMEHQKKLLSEGPAH